jgi:hypothetical protein
MPRPGRFTPRKATQYPFIGAGWAPGPVQKISHPPGFDRRQPVASRYTNGGAQSTVNILLHVTFVTTFPDLE